jgi:Arc/MetJ family transcription regulator
MMRTTLNIDEKALRQARRAAGNRATKTQVINDALRAYARWKRVAAIDRLRALGPWEGDLDVLRGRR